MLTITLRYDRKLPGLKLSGRARATTQHLLCRGRDGTIASRSINRENNVEALVIFKKIQFALESPNRYEFYSGAKKN